ncbi:putative gustatory receptor 59e [Calliphora vicina]|uniref:putative gustatory receptor 59e n=1 Tax=Calliphora vicina TaxID=7373 RepID=UPI00325B8423
MAVRIHQRKYNQQNELQSNVRDRNSLLNILKVLRIILQFLGVVPIMGTSKILTRLQQIWCSLLLLLIWVMCGQQTQSLPESFTTIEKGFYLSELIFNSMLPVPIYFISFVNRTKFLKIYEHIVSIYEQLKLCRGSEIRPPTPIYRQLKKEVLLLTFLLFSFYLFCILINVVNNHGFTIYVMQLVCAFHLPNMLISTNLCLYWLTLRVISLSNSYSNTILESFHEFSIPPNSSSLNITHLSSSLWYKQEFFTFNIRKSLKYNDIFITLTEISSSLDQLRREVTDIFRLVLILNFVNSFMILSIQYFAVYKYFDSPDVRKMLVFLLKFARLVLHTFNIIFVLCSNNAIIKEKCHTIYILNSLPVEALDMERNISGFLLQLMVRKHTVSVCDIFDLDLTFILSIISALSTYVIFLIQIDLGAVSIEERTATNAS